MILSPPSARSITLAILGMGLLAVLAANLPGQLSYDSIVQLADARVGRYHTWHPAVMAWLLGLGDAVLPGTAVYLTCVVTLIFAALALVVAAQPRVGWAAPPTVLLVAASPLMLVDQGVVWKDVLFADAAVSGFLLLAVATRPDRSRPGRVGLTVAAALLLCLAALVRQNGVIAPVFAALGIGAFAWGMHPELAARPRLARAAVVGGGVLLAILAVAALAGAALSSRRASDDVGAGGQLRLLKLYDLVGVAKRVPTVDLSALHATGLDAHVRAAVPLYTPLQNDSVSAEPGLDAAITSGAPGLDEAWRGAILHHPDAWVAHRLDVFRWIALPPDVTRCTAVYTGVDGPPELLAQLNLSSAWRAQDVKLAHYGEAFVRTPLYSHAFWGLAALVCIAALLATRAPDATILALMLGATLTYASSFLVIGIACDHRYLYALDLSVMAALVRIACDPRSVIQGFRRQDPAGEAQRPERSPSAVVGPRG